MENKIEKRKSNHPGPGQPRAYTPEELAVKLEEYLVYCEENNKAKSKIGLASFCDIDKNVLTEYNHMPEYGVILRKLEREFEKQLLDKVVDKDKYCKGQSFILANHFKYKDENSRNITINNQPAGKDFDISRLSARQAAILIALTKLGENEPITPEESDLLHTLL